ncbi:hypothetical protein TNCV_1466371 [Trichonephila clavipes]|nr:hypothetical protein TNCV_1466371 [Trichonephila clavipes]
MPVVSRTIKQHADDNKIWLVYTRVLREKKPPLIPFHHPHEYLWFDVYLDYPYAARVNFTCLKTGITASNRSKTNGSHTSVTVRDMTMKVGAVKLSVLGTFQNSGSLSPEWKEKCGRKWKTPPRMNKILIESSKLNPRTTSIDL